MTSLEGLSLSEGCMVCHSSTASRTPNPTLPQGVVTPRFSDHASHRYGILLVRGQKIGAGTIRNTIEPRIPLFEGRIECQTCHDITQPTVDYLVPFDPPYTMRRATTFTPGPIVRGRRRTWPPSFPDGRRPQDGRHRG